MVSTFILNLIQITQFLNLIFYNAVNKMNQVENYLLNLSQFQHFTHIFNFIYLDLNQKNRLKQNLKF